MDSDKQVYKLPFTLRFSCMFHHDCGVVGLVSWYSATSPLKAAIPPPALSSQATSVLRRPDVKAERLLGILSLRNNSIYEHDNN
jgi:hypothetical protein